jgi:hypothetical protein
MDHLIEELKDQKNELSEKIINISKEYKIFYGKLNNIELGANKLNNCEIKIKEME